MFWFYYAKLKDCFEMQYSTSPRCILEIVSHSFQYIAKFKQKIKTVLHFLQGQNF